jgi:hypothetical protein
MKKRLLFLSILVTFFSMGMEGCPDIDPLNYVVYTHTAHVEVQFVDPDGNPSMGSVSNVPLQVTIVKDGGERCTETLVTDTTHKAALICTFNVYKEQPVDASVDILDQNYSAGSAWCGTSWDTIFQNCGKKFGSSCSGSCTLKPVFVCAPNRCDYGS